MAVLEAERLLLVGEAEVLGRREMSDDVRRAGAGADLLDRGVHVVAGALVRLALLRGRAADVQGPVVARPVAHEGVDDVVVGHVPRPHDPIREDVRMGAAPLAGDGVDALHLFGAEGVEHVVDDRHHLALLHPDRHRAVQLVVGRVDHRRGGLEQRHLVLRLQLADVLHQRLAVLDLEPLGLERLQHRDLDEVDPDGIVVEAALAQDVGDPPGVALLDPDLLGDRAAPAGEAGLPALDREPGVVQLMLLRGRADVPEDRVGVTRDQDAAEELVAGPVADVARRRVPDVVHVEEEQRRRGRTR